MGALKKYSADFATYVAETISRASRTVLVAKPRKKPINYAALRKSTMARYSKTLARLAK
jgi:hypothetical protein